MSSSGGGTGGGSETWHLWWQCTGRAASCSNVEDALVAVVLMVAATTSTIGKQKNYW